MGKTRIVNLAKELKMEVRELIQRLKDDMGLQENFTYLSSLDEATVARARQVISAVAPQVEELRVGDNVKRRRRVAPAAGDPDRTAPGECPGGGSGAAATSQRGGQAPETQGNGGPGSIAASQREGGCRQGPAARPGRGTPGDRSSAARSDPRSPRRRRRPNLRS